MTTSPEKIAPKMTAPLGSSFQGHDSPCTPNPAHLPGPALSTVSEKHSGSWNRLRNAGGWRDLSRLARGWWPPPYHCVPAGMPLSTKTQLTVYGQDSTFPLAMHFVHWGLSVCMLSWCDLGLAERTSESEPRAMDFFCFQIIIHL